MILDFPNGNACLIVHGSNPSRPDRKSLEKMAFVLNRTVLSCFLPAELMSYVRANSDPQNGG